MLRYANVVLSTFLALGLLSCSGSSPESTSSPSKPAASKKASSSSFTGKQPCDLLTASLVANTIGVDQSLLTQEPYGDTLCTYRWNKANAEEIDQRNQKIMADYLPKKLAATQRGESLERPKMENTSAQVTLTMVDMKNAQSAERSFSAMIESVSKGITAEHEGTKATFRIIYDQEIQGIGDQAAWSAKSNQLSFRSDSHFLHVLVDIHTDSEANLVEAKKVASKLLGK